jgi:hypothetical protein
MAVVPFPSPPPPKPVVAAAVNLTARELAERRGVRFGRPLAVEVVDGAAMAAALAAMADAAYPPAIARDRERLLFRLGLAPDPDAPGGAGAAVAAGAAAPVGGLYDPARGRLQVADFVDLGAARFALTRDAAHAVLDRRFGLQRWLAPAVRPRAAIRAATGSAAGLTSDALWARQALLEGDATVQALEHLDRYGRLPSGRALAAVAERVRAALVAEMAGAGALDAGRRLFVYLDGLAFVAAERARAPWSAVDALWSAPPASTEQIFHPDKYRKRERPDPVAARLPERLAGGWRLAVSDSLGELGVRLFLARALDDLRAYRGAAGWGGDQALLFGRAATDERSDPERLAAWITTWDHEADAEDFAVLAAEVLGARAGAATTTTASATASSATTAPGEIGEPAPLRLTDPGGRLYALGRRGRTVAMLLGAPAGADGVLRELLDAATRHEQKRQRADRGQRAR